LRHQPDRHAAAKFEAAREPWLKAQDEFETAFGAENAAALRATLRRVAAV